MAAFRCSVTGASAGGLKGWGPEPSEDKFTHVWSLLLAVCKDLSWVDGWTPTCVASLGFLKTWWLGSQGEHPDRKPSEPYLLIAQPMEFEDCIVIALDEASGLGLRAPSPSPPVTLGKILTAVTSDICAVK